MNPLWRRIIHLAAVVMLAVNAMALVPGCERKTGPERVGEEAGEAVEEAGEAIEDAAER